MTEKKCDNNITDVYKEVNLKLNSGQVRLLIEVLDILIYEYEVPTPYHVGMCEVLQKIIPQYYEQMNKNIELVSYLDSETAKIALNKLKRDKL